MTISKKTSAAPYRHTSGIIAVPFERKSVRATRLSDPNVFLLADSADCRISTSLQRQLNDFVAVDFGNGQIHIPIVHRVILLGNHRILTNRTD